MSNEWLRLWHDMPNDPKWRTIARISGEPISLVQAIYVHLLVDASRNVTRGHVTVTKEDLASALDVSENQISAVLEAMQGRVLSDEKLSGWDRRQPKKEDTGNPETGAKSAAERKRDQRERERQAKQEQAESRDVTTGHEASRDVTLDKDKDKDIKELKENPPISPQPKKPKPESIKISELEFSDIAPDPQTLEVDLRRAGLDSVTQPEIEKFFYAYRLTISDEETDLPANWRKRFRRQLVTEIRKSKTGSRLTSLTPPAGAQKNGTDTYRPPNNAIERAAAHSRKLAERGLLDRECDPVTGEFIRAGERPLDHKII